MLTNWLATKVPAGIRAPIITIALSLACVAIPSVTLAQPSFDEQVQTMYLAYYGRPGDPGGIDFWSQRLSDSNGDLFAIIEEFGNSEEYNERFGDLDSTSLVNNVFQQLFSRDADPEGLAFYVERLDSKAMTLASIALNIIDGVRDGTDDADIVANRMQVADAYTHAVRDGQFDYGSDRIDSARTLLDGVDGSDQSLLLALAEVDSTLSRGLPEPGIVGDGALASLVEQVRDDYGMPAMAVILVRRGAIAEMASSGLRVQGGSEPVTDNDLWHLGSIGKAMTATLVGALVEQGAIGWDSTPAQVFPQLVGEMHPAYENVSVAQLLAHQAALPFNVGNIPSLDLVDDSGPGTVTDKRFLWARELLATPPLNDVGVYRYTNAGYIVAGAMLEAVTGDSWENLMTQQVFLPLGMNQTGFGPPGSGALRDQPWGHIEDRDNLEPVSPGSPNADNPAALGPAGTMHSSLSDYARYMLAHLAGERGEPGLLTASTFQFLHAPFDGVDYGMGWEVNNSFADIGPIFQHAGSNLRWLAQVGLAPGLDIGVLVVTNAAGNEAQAAVDALGNLMVLRILASE